MENLSDRLTLSVNRIAAEGSRSSFESFRETSTQRVKELATNIMKNPGLAGQIGALVGSVVEDRNPKAYLSTKQLQKTCISVEMDPT